MHVLIVHTYAGSKSLVCIECVTVTDVCLYLHMTLDNISDYIIDISLQISYGCRDFHISACVNMFKCLCVFL